jgi:hypothetical protein
MEEALVADPEREPATRNSAEQAELTLATQFAALRSSKSALEALDTFSVSVPQLEPVAEALAALERFRVKSPRGSDCRLTVEAELTVTTFNAEAGMVTLRVTLGVPTTTPVSMVAVRVLPSVFTVTQSIRFSLAVNWTE